MAMRAIGLDRLDLAWLVREILVLMRQVQIGEMDFLPVVDRGRRVAVVDRGEAPAGAGEIGVAIVCLWLELVRDLAPRGDRAAGAFFGNLQERIAPAKAETLFEAQSSSNSGILAAPFSSMAKVR